MTAITDKLTHVGQPGTITSLQAPGKAIGAGSINIGSATNWPTDTAVYFAMRVVNTGSVTSTNPSGIVAGTYTEWKGTVSGTVISNLTLVSGTDQVYAAGSNTQVYIGISAAQMNSLIDAVLLFANQDGTLIPAAVRTALGITSTSTDWNILNAAVGPNTVTYNGNRSYDLVFNGVDLTSVVNPGTRLRTTRTVAAPTQSTSLNGTTQFYSKTSPAGSTQTDNITPFAWVKPSAYQAGTIISQTSTPGTNGWQFSVNSSGQIVITGAGRSANSYQSVPLNKWLHVAATITMSTSTAQIYIDGIAVPTTALSSTGSSWTSAGSLQIGAANSLTFFAGKIAQAGFASTSLTATQIKSIYSQGITAALITSLSVVSAYSFNNDITDLNTTNANNLTANGSAVATNADSPFGGQANGTISSTLDYAEVVSVSFSTNTTVTVRTPQINTIPTSGGVASVVYSSNQFPYGWPGISNILALVQLGANATGTTAADILGLTLTVNVPTGRGIKLKSWQSAMSCNAAGAILSNIIAEGSTVIARADVNEPAANYQVQTVTETTIYPTAGSHTYKVQAGASGGTFTLVTGATAQTFLSAELV